MAYQASKDPSKEIRARLYLPELFKGVAVSAGQFFRNLLGTRDPHPDALERKGLSKVTTVQYPEERMIYPPGYRGLHRLVPRDDGKPRCVACYMCATICPAQCIYIEAGEYDEADGADASRVIEKFPTRFVIDELRCIVCGLCVEACPKDAIRMDTGVHTPSEYTRAGFIYDIPKLLKGPPVSHPSDPWNRREDSQQPHHQPKEAHARIGDGLVALKLPEGAHGHAAQALPAGEVLTPKTPPAQVHRFEK